MMRVNAARSRIILLFWIVNARHQVDWLLHVEPGPSDCLFLHLLQQIVTLTVSYEPEMSALVQLCYLRHDKSQLEKFHNFTFFLLYLNKLVAISWLLVITCGYSEHLT